MSSVVLEERGHRTGDSLLDRINGKYHKVALWGFMAIVVAHLFEHGFQAVQIWGLGWERPAARGLLGLFFPWLVTSEALHYGYAIIMLAGLIVLQPGFAGRARAWWNAALIIQVWHHLEHALLLGQAAVGSTLFGAEVPTSIAQLVIPRVELHLLYNGLVFIPMLVAMLYHLFPSSKERSQVSCSCALGRDSKHAEHAAA
jgi:hypothetical protein